MQTGMNIGTVVDKDSLDALTQAIISIMSAPGDQETIRHGIDALARMARVEGVTIQHCVIRGDNTVKIGMDEPDKPASEKGGTEAGMHFHNEPDEPAA